MVFICVGVYSSDNNAFDVFVVLGFGVVGYLMRVFDYPAMPVLLGFIMGPLLEEHFRRALLLSRGDLTVFFDRPISLAFMLLAISFLAMAFLPGLRKKAMGAKLG